MRSRHEPRCIEAEQQAAAAREQGSLTAAFTARLKVNQKLGLPPQRNSARGLRRAGGGEPVVLGCDLRGYCTPSIARQGGGGPQLQLITEMGGYSAVER